MTLEEFLLVVIIIGMGVISSQLVEANKRLRSIDWELNEMRKK